MPRDPAGHLGALARLGLRPSVRAFSAEVTALSRAAASAAEPSSPPDSAAIMRDTMRRVHMLPASMLRL